MPQLAQTVARTREGFFQKRIITPLLDLLRQGASPRSLAWSLAVGAAVGINPLLGSTTIACLVIAVVLRVNIVASQISNHLVYPLQLALFFVFIHIGDKFFHTGSLPLEGRALFEAARNHPIATTRLLWGWEWHALIIWFFFVLVAVPVMVTVLTPILSRLLHTLHTHADASGT